MQRTRLATAAAAAALPLVAGLLAAPASAAPAPVAKPILGKLITPLSVAATPSGTVYVSQNFAGLLTKKRPGHKPKVVFAAPKKNTEVGAVSVKKGVVTFATTRGTRGLVWKMNKKGKVSQVADAGAWESSANPDGDTVYGLTDLDAECEAQWPTDELGPVKYNGIVETHPYATTKAGGTTYLADAAGNSILGIASDGTVSTVAVLPPVPVEITAEAVEALGLPECVTGHDYLFEPVPTDVEKGPDGMLYVSSLPGGPEDGSLGANGSVMKVDPATGEATQVAGGLVSVTGVAVADNGDVYAAQLFAGSIVRIPAGTSTPEEWKSVVMPADVEWTDDATYATVNALSEPPAGKVQRWAN